MKIYNLIISLCAVLLVWFMLSYIEIVLQNNPADGMPAEYSSGNIINILFSED